MLFFVPTFFLWNITGDMLTYHQEEQCATITGNAEADDSEKKYHLKAGSIKAKMSSSSSAQENKPTANEVWAEGSIHFTTEELDVRADKAYFHPNTKMVDLEGNVVVTHKQNVAKGDTATIDIVRQTYTLHKAKGTIQDPKAIKPLRKSR